MACILYRSGTQIINILCTLLRQQGHHVDLQMGFFLRREEASFLSFKVGWGKHGVRVWDIPDTGKWLIQISVFLPLSCKWMMGYCCHPVGQCINV